MLGTGEPAAPYAIEQFQLDEVRYYVRRAARRLEAFAANLPIDLMPEPCALLRQVRLVGRLRGALGRKRTTSAAWPTSRGSRRHGCGRPASRPSPCSPTSTGCVSPASHPRRWRGSSSRRGCRRRAQPPVRASTRSWPTSRGSASIVCPLPDPHDLFFDFEGDPMHPGGLEYLCGVLWRASPGDAEGEPVPGRPGAALPRLLGPRSRAGEASRSPS